MSATATKRALTAIAVGAIAFLVLLGIELHDQTQTEGGGS